MTGLRLFNLRFGRERGALPPLGPLVVCGALQRAGVRWALVDVAREPWDEHRLAEVLAAHLEECAEDVLALSVFNDALPVLVAALSRARLGGRRVIVGGPGVVGVERRLLAAAPAIEAVVTGDGEDALPSLVRQGPEPVDPPGVTRRGGRRRLVAPSAGLPRASSGETDDRPSSIPWAWCAGRGYSVVPIWTARGCPFACQFCEVSRLSGRRVVRRDPLEALDDVERAAEVIDSRRALVLDDTFTLNPRHTRSFCDGLRARSVDLEFEFFSRTDVLPRETMAVLAEAGARTVSFGLDAGDPDLLQRVAKGIRLEEAGPTILEASRHFEVTVNVVWGYPFETLRQFESALAFLRRLRDGGHRFRIRALLHWLQPSAGTPLFDSHCAELAPDPYALARESDPAVRAVAQDRWLGAAFHRYRTDSLDAKLRLLESFRREEDAPRPVSRVGRAKGAPA